MTPGIPEGNDTRWLFANSGVRATLPDGSDLQVAVNTNFEEFHSNFLAVPGRNASAIRGPPDSDAARAGEIR